MDFAQALDDHPTLTRLGDTQLSYRSSLYVGESRPLGGAWMGDAALLSALTVALASIALLVARPLSPAVVGAGLLGLLAAPLFWAARALDRRSRIRRRFVLHFATHQLRLELPRPRRLSVEQLLLPFDAVREIVPVEARAPRGRVQQLRIRWQEADGAERDAVLVDGLQEGEQEGVERLQRLLEGAFGL